MISPVSSALLTGGVVATANVVDKKGLSFRQLAGVGIYSILLAVLNETNPNLAAQFGLLVLIGVLFTYTPRIVKALGMDK